MGAKKYILGAILAFAVLAIPAAYAEDYVILTPGAGDYYNYDFYRTAVDINSSLSPNATIVNFTTMPDDTARSAVASKNPKYIYLVVQPANLSPDFLNSVDNLTKWLDSDPYVDVGWSIITGYDNTSAKDLFDRNMDASWSNNYVFVPFSSSSTVAQVAAGSQIASRIPGSSIYTGITALATVLATALNWKSDVSATNVNDFVYFSGSPANYSSTTALFSGDNKLCPATDGSKPICDTAATEVQRILFFADASDAGRVNGTNTDTTWATSNPLATYGLSLPIAFFHNQSTPPGRAAAYIAPHSTRWATSENMVKLFTSSLAQGMDISSALRFAKNALLFNSRNESLASVSNFTEFVASEYVLFGKLQKPAPSPAVPDYNVTLSPTHEPGQVVYSNNVTNIKWNATATVSTSAASALYSPSLGWQASGAVAWYKYVDASPVSGRINMSIVAALAGEIKPDKSALSVLSFSGQGALRNITAINISVNQTTTDYIANDSLAGVQAARYANDTDRIYFARLFSPNEIIAAEIFSVNISYVTEGVRINLTSVSGTENILSEGVSAANPADSLVLNATLLYAVPFNIASSCSSSAANCTLVDSGTSRYANVTLAALPAGTTFLTIYYNTTLDINTTLDNNYIAYNRGETITVRSNVSSANTTVLDYNLRLVDSGGRIAWSNSTEDIPASAAANMTVHTFVLPQNISGGIYNLETYYLSNSTGLYASYEKRSIQINDSLNLSGVNFTATVGSKLDQSYFNASDSLTATGSVLNIRGTPMDGANVIVSLIGDTTESSTSVMTNSSGVYATPFNWTSGVGTKTLQVVANYSNNTGRQNNTIHITNYMGNSILVSLDSTRLKSEGAYIFNSWETPNVTVIVKDASGTKDVYKARVSAHGISDVSGETGTTGTAVLTYPAQSTASYVVNVSAYSPLNTSKIVYNTSRTVHVKWLKTWGANSDFVTSQSPSSAIVSTPVTFYGNLTMSSGNETLITRPSDALDYQIKTGGLDVRNISSCSLSWEGTNSTKFSLSCTPPLAGSYQLVMQAKLAYDGVDIKTNDTYSFSVGTNATTPPSSGSSGSGTSSSIAGKSCTTNANCSSGDYCSNNVCTAITCTDGAIINHACVPNKKVNVTLQSQVIEVEQGKWGIANFTLSNNGFVGFSGVTFTLYLPQGILWNNWYSFVSPAPATLAAGVERIVSANISVPENASIDQYSIKAKVTTKEGATDEKTFALRVSPSARNRDLVKVGIAEMNSTIDALEKDVLEIMGGAPDDERKIAERKLDDIRALYIEAQAAISKGNYFEAYTKQKEMSDVISGLRVILADKKAKDSQAASRRNMIAGVAIIIAAIAGGFYYLWVPAPSGYSPGRGYSYNSGGKKNMDLDGIVDEVKKKIADIISKLKRQDAVVSRKYDYLKPPAKRW